ncbi:glycosyltransferase family 2 protein [Sphingomonas sp. NBWT7]|uniref:glycosyltransferase family 2 protein n=1 Tax=Sphingomonas sp. NBWT7 TaxID=2596913 RepID=UPI00162AA4F0|nr:glycosyltransferase family 2 protein [Sphingomonas sp. NBWT7]QNE32444.1 glycosyltransferase family 2 protein [Sphingomonas sp. NBWT7]
MPAGCGGLTRLSKLCTCLRSLPRRSTNLKGFLRSRFLSKLPAVAILLVCRNRRDTTVAAVRRLREQTLALLYRVVLFDDASTDGTAAAVLAEVPDAVVVAGDGSAFWNGGLHRAWQRALDLTCDAFLWLNDDVELDPDAFGRLAEAWMAMRAETGGEAFILAGATRGSGGDITYGGLRHVPTPFAFRLAATPPTAELQPIDTFNGNIVLVPRAVVERIGINDPAFHHNLGDMDYGLRASRAGIPVRLLPGTLGRCDANRAKRERGFGSRSLTLRDQWRKVNSHHGLPFRSWLHFTRKHSGSWWPLHFLLPYRRLVVPRFGTARTRGHMAN